MKRQTWSRAHSTFGRSTLPIVVAAALTMSGFTWPWETSGPWPNSSRRPVPGLDHLTLEQRLADHPPSNGFRFVVYGDQRALADGEWQKMLVNVRATDVSGPVSFIIDTGDIVQDGRFTDQFWMLREILEPVRHLPVLLAVGNHELKNNRSPQARSHTARFFSYLDPDFSTSQMYYRKNVGPVRFLFLDSNDLVYEGVASAGPSQQMTWLRSQLADLERRNEPVVVVLHHPFMQSSVKHQESAQFLWSYRPEGAGGLTLPELLLDAGVDLVLVGHTHTYERFQLGRNGRTMQLVNLSGRPRTSFLWIGDGSRRAHDIRGRELAHLQKQGWSDLEGWTVTQEWAMVEDAANQFAVFDVGWDGSIWMAARFVEGEETTAMRDSLFIAAP